MKVLQLRNHIPMGGPARREPVAGDETDMRVSLGFEPAWFCRRCGVDFSERWHTDPVYRYESLSTMKGELVKAFPAIAYWDPDNTEDLATLSGCYGAYVIPRVFGIPLRYVQDRWPELEQLQPFSDRELEALDAKRLLSGPFVEELFGQMDVIEREWGTIHGYLNWQGVLNNAFHLRKQEIFLDMIDRPDFARGLFELITDVMIGLARMVQARQRHSGFAIDQFSVSNCTLNMVSPQHYREQLLPWDRRIAESFERFGVHTCNWDVTPYIDVLSALPKVGYLDMGMMSDMVRVREVFPGARRAVMYHPQTLDTADAAVIEDDAAFIEADMAKIYRELAPCDVVMADVKSDTSDERIRSLLRICGDLESRKEVSRA